MVAGCEEPLLDAFRIVLLGRSAARAVQIVDISVMDALGPVSLWFGPAGRLASASGDEHRESDAKNAAGGNFEYRKSFYIGWETARLVAMIKNGQIFSSDLRCRGANGQASIFSRDEKVRAQLPEPVETHDHHIGAGRTCVPSRPLKAYWTLVQWADSNGAIRFVYLMSKETSTYRWLAVARQERQGIHKAFSRMAS